jgi:hypothetical protein
MKKAILLTVAAAFILFGAGTLVSAEDASIVSTSMSMSIRVENVYNAFGVQISGIETTTTSTNTSNSLNETSSTTTIQTVYSEWRGGSVKVDKIEGTSDTKASDDSYSHTTFSVDYDYESGTGKLSSASGGSSTNGSYGTDANGEAIGTYNTNTTETYTIKNGQALRTQSSTTGASYGPDGTKKADIKQSATYGYSLAGGSWQLTAETTVSENIGVDGSSEKITRSKTYSRDKNGVLGGVSQTASGTKVVITSAGASKTLTMHDYSAEFEFGDAGWYLKKESYTWEEGAADEGTADEGTADEGDAAAEAEG